METNEQPTFEVFKYDGDDHFTCIVDAPAGKVFADTGSHSIRDVAPTKAKATKMAKAYAAGTLAPCEEVDCDACAESQS